jgi:hypothetical protein
MRVTIPNAPSRALGLRDFGVALNHQHLNRDCAFDSGDDRGKLQEQPVAQRLHDPAVQLGHDRPCGLAMFADAQRSSRRVLAHQSGVADDVDSHDRGEAAAGGSHFSGKPALRKASNDGFKIGWQCHAVWERRMRCYFMKDGHIADVEPEALEGLSDQQAVERARQLFEARRDKFDGFEVREGARVIIQEPPPKLISSPSAA